MRCLYCGLLQDEPVGVKVCAHCGGELAFEGAPPAYSYVQAWMALDQVHAPADQIVERHLIVTLETPTEVPAEEAAPTATGREPLAFVAVLDVSGSMRGPKMDAAKEAVRQAVRRLRGGDIFSLVTFSSHVQTVLPPGVVNSRLQSKVEQALQALSATGSTALCGGLEAGLAAAAQCRQETNLVLLLSDGQANVGETDLEMIGTRAFAARTQGITTSTLGVGTDYNEALMVEIATQGGGRFYHVLQAHQIAPYVAGELGEMSALAALGAQLKLALPSGAGLRPFSSAYVVCNGGTVDVGDIPVDTHLEVVLRLLLPPQEAGARLRLEGVLAYRSPGGHTLETPLNVVTLRYAPAAQFSRRDGAVRPVVERVVEQMRASGVLSSVRAAALHGQTAAEERSRISLAELRDYASLLGDERAEELAQEGRQLFAAMAAAPSQAKATVREAFRSQRGGKDFEQ
jgi:Ca-activated chloride channel family protein